MDRARAARGRVAADLRASQVEFVPEHVDQHPARLDVERDRLAVDDKSHRDRHRNRGARFGGAQAAAPTAATSSRALPMPSTIRSIWSSVITKGGEMWIACARR